MLRARLASPLCLLAAACSDSGTVNPTVLSQDFFGLGERYVTVDHRGRAYTCWTEEGGIAVGEKAPAGPSNPGPNGPGMTRVPVPFFLSSKGYGLYVDTTYRVSFDFGAGAPTAFRFAAMAPSLRFHVFVNDDPKQTLAAYTALTGRAHLSEPGGAKRVRITSAPASESTLAAGPLLLKAWRAPKPTRVRWDVLVKLGG